MRSTKTKKTRSLYRTTALISAGFLSQVVFNAALAQDDTIIVTATRRSENIQDVPIAVTAINTEQLERAGVADIRNLTSLSASFNTSNAQTENGSTTIRIRGVGTTGNNSGLESSVAVFLDGVYLSRPAIALGDLVDLQQIEVLRGPQGTLFGRNTSAGALNITTKKPNLSEVDAFANVTYGNFDLANFQGGISIPLAEDTFGVRLSGAVRRRDGILNSVTGAESGTRQRHLLRGQALLEPNDSFSLRIIGDYAKSDELCCDAPVVLETPLVAGGAYAAVGLPANGGVTFSGDSAFESRLSNAEQFRNGFEQWGVSAELNLDFGFANLTYIPAYREFDGSNVQESDFVNLRVFSVGGSTAAPGEPPQATQFQIMTHEVRLQGTALEDHLDWLLGVYYSNEDIDEVTTLTLGEDYQQYLSALIIGLVGGPAGPFGPNPFLVFAGGASATGNFASNHYTQNSESISFFTHNVIDLTDWLNLTVGLRYVDETKDGAFEQLDATPVGTSACEGVLAMVAGGGGVIPAALIPTAIGATCFPFATRADLPGSGAGGVFPTPVTFADTFEDNELIYTVKAGVNLGPDVSVYGGFTHGFKSGGFNLDSTAAVLGADPRFASEKIDAYEIGLKSTLFNGAVRANIAVFHQEMTDFQVLEFTGIQFQTFNVPKAKSTGAELELQAALSDSLSFNTSLTYANARYPDDCDAGTVPASVAARVSNLCGVKLTNAPEFVGIFGATYERQITDSGWGMFLTGSARLESDRRTSTQPSNPATGVLLPLDIQPSNTKINVRAGISAPDHRWTIEGWSNNVTDKQTKFVTFNIPLRTGARGTFIQEPRTYGVTVRGQF